MSKKLKVKTNLLGRHVQLTEAKRKAASSHLDNWQPPPWTNLYPDGGEVVAVYTDGEALNIVVSTDQQLVTLVSSWLRVIDGA